MCSSIGRARRLLAFCLLLGPTLALLPGCETPPPATDTPDVTLRDIRSNVTPPDDAIRDLEPGGSAIPADAAVRARVTTLSVPLNQSVNAAWKTVDEDVFPALTRGVWHGNGLRIGLLQESQLEAFLDALPGTRADDRVQRVIGGPRPMSLLRSRPLAARFFADLTVPPFAPKRETVRGNRLHLLISFKPQPGGFTRVELTPHHHKPRHILRARTDEEKLLDGRRFDELAVTVAVPSDRFLVLGLARDPSTLPPEPAEPDGQAPDGEDRPTKTADAGKIAEPARNLILQNAGESTTPHAEDEPAPESETTPTQPDTPNLFPRRIQPLPLNLGRALMTEAVPGGEAQVLLLMKIEPLQ